MPNLHAHYHHGNIKAFRQELDGTGSAVPSSGGGGRSGTSAGKSWTMSGMNGVPVKADPNERDQYGRTWVLVTDTYLAI